MRRCTRRRGSQLAIAAVQREFAKQSLRDRHHLHPYHEGWLYLATVIDLFSRQVVDWSTGSRIDTQLPLDALHMALWRRRPHSTVTVHSDQGCQFTSHEWQRFLASHNLQPSMSRRGNCHDNAVAEGVVA